MGATQYEMEHRTSEEQDDSEESGSRRRQRRTCGEFFTKYFLQGQTKESEIVAFTDEDSSTWWTKFHERNKNYIALLIPFVIVQTLWLLTAFKHDFFSLYETRWPVPLTMVLAATVAGMTSEGGGAVSFPVLTLALQIHPTVARDFALMMQSIGMGSALFAILYMGVLIEKKAILFATLGCVPGIIVGLTWLDPLLGAHEKKMFFVSVWASFAAALYLLNSEKKRKTYPIIPYFCTWKALVLVATGFVGGIFTAFAGSGVDICTFSLITLLFRVTEKTATPTTVVLMGINSSIGFFWRAVMMGDIDIDSWNFLAISTPVAAAFAPLGSVLGSHFHRLVLAVFVYVLEVVAIVGFLFTKPEMRLILIGGVIILVGFTFFSVLSRLGKLLLLRNERKLVQSSSTKQLTKSSQYSNRKSLTSSELF